MFPMFSTAPAPVIANVYKRFTGQKSKRTNDYTVSYGSSTPRACPNCSPYSGSRPPRALPTPFSLSVRAHAVGDQEGTRINMNETLCRSALGQSDIVVGRLLAPSCQCPIGLP